MAEQYWSMYFNIYECERYYWYYGVDSKRKDILYTGFMLVMTAGGVASWTIWSHIPWVWGLVLGASQIISVIKILFPYAKRITTVKFLSPEFDNLLLDIKHTWGQIENRELDDSSINNLIYEYERRKMLLEGKYADSTMFPPNRWCQKRALADRRSYFYEQYGISESEVLHDAKKYSDKADTPAATDPTTGLNQ